MFCFLSCTHSHCNTRARAFALFLSHTLIRPVTRVTRPHTDCSVWQTRARALLLSFSLTHTHACDNRWGTGSSHRASLIPISLCHVSYEEEDTCVI